MAKLHPTESNENQVSKYRAYESELDCSDISFPFELNSAKLKSFEKKNDISINVFAWEKGLFPRYVSEFRVDESRQIDLLLITDGEAKHFCLVKSLSRLLSGYTNHQSRVYICRYCIHRFSGNNALKNYTEHVVDCGIHGPQRIRMPHKKPILSFDKFEWMEKVSHVIYCDFESILRKYDSSAPNETLSSTTKVSEHLACGFSYLVVGPDGEITIKYGLSVISNTFFKL